MWWRSPASWFPCPWYSTSTTRRTSSSKKKRSGFPPSAPPTISASTANVVAFDGLLVSLPLVFNFDHTKDYQFEEKAQWIPSLGATYHIGIDGLGLLLVMLTTVVGFLAI